ncbi:MAG: hypothetical protein ACYS8W_02240 [Planctomycetota bacterium]|jgi:hypothetical protein
MNKGIAVVVFVLIAGLAGGLAYCINQNTMLSQELNDLKDQQRRIRKTVTAAIGEEVTAAEGTLVSRVKAVENKLEEQAAATKEIAEWKENVAAPLVSKLSPKAVPNATSQLDREEVGRLIESKVREEREKLAPIGRKPSLKRLAAVLELDARQTESVREASFDKQRQLLELMKIRREDGGSFAEDLADAIEAEGEAGAVKVFFKLMGTKIPDRETSYLEEIMKLSQGLREEYRAIMSEEQFAKYEESGVEPMDVEIEGNPFEEYLKEQLEGR